MNIIHAQQLWWLTKTSISSLSQTTGKEHELYRVLLIVSCLCLKDYNPQHKWRLGVEIYQEGNSEGFCTLRYLTSFWICQYSVGRSSLLCGRRCGISSSSSLSVELSLERSAGTPPGLLAANDDLQRCGIDNTQSDRRSVTSWNLFCVLNGKTAWSSHTRRSFKDVEI